MTTVVLAEKECRRCDETKPASEFYRDRSTRDRLNVYCKPCCREIARTNRTRRRAEMGDEAFLADLRTKVNRHRERTGNASGKRYAAARVAAVSRLIEAHRKEYDALLAAEKYERGMS